MGGLGGSRPSVHPLDPPMHVLSFGKGEGLDEKEHICVTLASFLGVSFRTYFKGHCTNFATELHFQRDTFIFCMNFDLKIVSMIRKYHNHKLQTNPRHREEKPHNNHETPGRQTERATSSLFPFEMIAKLEWK